MSRARRPLALGVLSALSGVALLAVSGWLIVRAAERPPVLALLTAIVVVRALGLVRALARYGERLTGHDLALRELARERVAWYRRLARRIGAAGVPGAADLLTRFTSDVDALQDRVLRVRLPLGVAAIAAPATALAAALLLPSAGVAMALGLALAGVGAPAAVHALARRAVADQAPARASLAARLHEALELGPELALRGAGTAHARELRRAAARLDGGERRIARAAAIGQALATGAAGGTLLAVLALGTAATARGELAPVALGALVLLAVGAFEVVRPLPEAALRRVAVERAVHRLSRVVDGPPLLADAATDADAARPATRSLPAGPAALSARGIVHRPGGPGTPVVLDGIDLDVMPGERIALIGPSGGGKSTLASILARLADPDAGEVRLGGVPLRDAAVADVRSRIRLAGQDAHLLAGTLAANLRIGAPDADEPAMAAALRSVGLGTWLDALPAGLGTLVGEDGVAVSGGQRQRIGVARALLSPAPLLILDEPTAMLDAATADALLDDVLAATEGRTLVVVTHDNDRLAPFERVLALRDGRLRSAAGGRDAGSGPQPPSRPARGAGRRVAPLSRTR